MLFFKSEAETPILLFDRMLYLYNNDKFAEIEFLGHVFGFPISKFNEKEYQDYIFESLKKKEEHFKSIVRIERLTDIDIALQIMNK